ncbi:phage holin, lambda family [Stutzerimonas urumqiensis]|uniref:phage holin, lambda family n=1 Tax=Stutzerimonas urumqiensis TaxID=638269 RepID=UPI003DA4C3EE
MRKMPEKSPDVWAAALAWLSVIAPHLYAFALSVTIAVLRVIYGGGTKRQMVLEGALCGLATLTLVPLLEWLGLPQNMATFAGGAVGFLGTEKLRDLAVKFGERKAAGQ